MPTTATEALLIAAAFTTYPAAGDRRPVLPRAAAEPARIEAVTDKGLVLEMVVKCRNGAAIVTFSKAEGLYCGAKAGCQRSITPLLKYVCG